MLKNVMMIQDEDDRKNLLELRTEEMILSDLHLLAGMIRPTMASMTSLVQVTAKSSPLLPRVPPTRWTQKVMMTMMTPSPAVALPWSPILSRPQR